MNPALGTASRHRGHDSVEDLHLLLAEIQLLARLRNFLLELQKIGVERSVILRALTRETSVSRHDLLTGGSYERLLLAGYI